MEESLRDDSEFLVPSLQRVLDTALGTGVNAIQFVLTIKHEVDKA